MSKTIIDWTVWQTAKQLIDERKEAGFHTTPQMVTHWKRRGNVEYEHFTELGKDLIRRGSLHFDKPRTK